MRRMPILAAPASNNSEIKLISCQPSGFIFRTFDDLVGLLGEVPYLNQRDSR